MQILVLSAWLCIVAALPPTVVAALPTVVAALPTWRGAAASAATAALAATATIAALFMHRAAQREARPVHVAKCAWHWQ